MAMTLPIQLPTTPSSDAANGAPATPVSPAASQDNSTSPSSANNNSVSSTTNANSTNNSNSNNANNNTTANANVNGSAAAANAGAQMKRKPSRRANTAERRATHNAVERQRRETLNGRFLDLAALLPNLSQIRRPSKSSIVNSSIAHIHASRRHRLLASRELRLIKLEADALRRELNEWRDRAGIPRVDEPVRGEGFSMVLGGELELIAPIAEEGDEDEDGGDGEGEVHAGVGGGYGYVGGAGDEDMDDYSSVPPLSAGGMHQHPAMMGIAEDEVMKNPFAHNPPSQQQHQQQGGQVHLTHILPRPGTGGMMSPVYDGPLGMYDHHPNHPSSHHGNHPSHHAHGGHNGHPMMHHQGNQYPPSSYPHPHPSHPSHPSHPNHPSAHHGHGPHHSMSHQQQMEAEKMAAYAAHVYGSSNNNNAQQAQAQRSLFTPPATSHGLPSSAANGNPNSAISNGSGNGNGTGSSTGSGPNSPAHSSGSPIQAGFPVPSDQFFAYQQQQQAQRAGGYASSPSDDGSHHSMSIPLSHPSHPNNQHHPHNHGGAHPIPMKRGAGGGRDRAGSLALSVGSAGSFGGSPVGSPSYELSHGEYMGVGVPRRGGGAAAGWVGAGAGREEMMGNGGMVAVGGGGGNGAAFAMMM